MSFFGAIGNAIKGVGHFAGKVLSNPIVEGAAGLFGGPLAGAAVGGLGHLIAPGGNLGNAVGGALQGGLAGGVGGSIRKLGTGVLTGGIGGMLHPTGTYAPTSTDPYGSIIDYDEGGNPIYGDQRGGFWGGVRKLGSGILNAAGGNGGGGLGGLGNLAVGGLAGYQAINAANASKRAGQLSDQAINLATQRWNEAAPLRNAGQARLLNPIRPDLTSVYQDTTNPFAVRKLKAG